MEDNKFLKEQLITYLGNKRSLLHLIDAGIKKIQDELNMEKIISVDLFSGSGIVARYLKQYSSKVITNDLEGYSKTINECYLTNKSEFDENKYNKYKKNILKNMKKYDSGFIQEMYAPNDDKNIKKNERVFYTTRNAKFIDSFRQAIDVIPKNYRKFFIAPLLSEASIKNNTAGVFKGFYKNSKTGVGQFGGNAKNSLSRIMADIEIKEPIFSNYECDYEIYNEDSLELIKKLPKVNLIYIDPPYNQHPYSSNYFMLNIINEYKKPQRVSKVSGIPENWNKSKFNKMDQAKEAIEYICENAKTDFIMLSFNNEGFISKNELNELLSKFGNVTLIEEKYNAYRASRNLSNRKKYVEEMLFIIDMRKKQNVRNDI